ncbi:MAG: hypothetical protein AB1847_00145 [bacterium]
MKAFKACLRFMIIFSFLALILAGCGSGGGGGGSDTNGTTISGIASKGLIKGGNVTVFALDQNGNKGQELGMAVTDPNGAYSVPIGSYTGNVLVEVVGGRYIDEATDADTPAPPLKAALAHVQGSVSVAITPLTDIAVACTGGVLTGENIEGANHLVEKALGITDIVRTMPHGINASTANFTAAHYGLMLAAISQMASTQAGDAIERVAFVIKSIAEDLMADHKLDLKGQDILDAYDAFTKNSPRNHTGIWGVPQIIQTAIAFAIEHDPVPDITLPGPTDLIKAKKLVADLRNTALSIYGYNNGAGMKGILETPFKNLSEELTTKIGSDLASTGKRIGWIVDSAKQIHDQLVVDGKVQSGFHTYTQDGLKLDITVTEAENNAGFSMVEFTVMDVSNELNATTLDDGNLTLTADDSGNIISGTFIARMTTPMNDKLTASADYTGTYDGDTLTGITLTGLITAPGNLSFDFSGEGRKLSVLFAHIPDDEPQSEKEWKNYYPTNLYFSGRFTTATAQLDGVLDIPEIVRNLADDSDTCRVPDFMPKAVTFNGTFQERKNGSLSGTKFSGKITGNWQNAATFNCCSPKDTGNFPVFNASFDGIIEAPQRPTIVTYLAVSQTQFQIYDLTASYRRIHTDGTIILLGGNGSVNDETHLSQATLSNQDQMTVTFSYNYANQNKEDTFHGDITASSTGVKMADLYSMNGMPTVKYLEDDYIETIF